MCSYLEYPDLKTEDELRQCAIATDNPSDLSASIDGVEVKDIRTSYASVTSLFPLTYPENNIGGVSAGPSEGVSHMWLLIVKPLSIGTHDIVFSQLTLPNPSTGEQGFGYKVTYHIKVVPRTLDSHAQIAIIGNQSIPVQLNSSSTISDFKFNENNTQVSFKVSESGPQGLVVLPVGAILNGPYHVMVDEMNTSNFEVSGGSNTTSQNVKFAYPSGAHDVVITGTSIVPEFGTTSLIILVVSMSAIIGTMTVVARTKHIRWI
jgi:hypothetical protein